MDKKKTLTLAALLAASAAGNVYLAQNQEYVQVEVTPDVSDTLVASLNETIKAEVLAASPDGECHEALVYYAGDAKPTKAWVCGGAVMPRRVQKALDAAVE